MRLPITVFIAVLATACGSSSNSTTSGSGSSSGTSGSTGSSSSSGSSGSSSSGSSSGSSGSSGCTLAANTTPTSTVTSGCALLERDTSNCEASRTPQGLSGAWLKFSCRVTLTATQVNGRSEIAVGTDSQPDYPSNYFPTSNACYAAYTPSFPDPNSIAAQNLSVKVPLAPDTSAQAMGLGPVGVAVNGVAIFDNQAAPGDDIYTESGSFDECQGHPAPGGTYHYHSEPYAISVDDARLIGVLKDGYFLYGRRDADGSLPTLDAAGGHTGTTPDSPTTPVYHHHVNLQTSTNSGTAGQQVWFLTTGQYAGTPG